MDVADILPSLTRLDGEVDNLEGVLQPLLGNLSDVSSKLPLLDKAKLYVLVTYALESMLFSSLRLNEVDARNHPVFKELTRVRQYFDKIKAIENPVGKPEQRINKEAAARFIKADLSDQKDVSAKLSELIAKERAALQLKEAELREKKKRKAEESATGNDSEATGQSSDGKKKQKKSKGKKSSSK